MSNVTVCARFRPLRSKEIGDLCVRGIDPETFVIQDVEEDEFTFSLDRVFYEDSAQAAVYDFLALPIMRNAVNAINGTIITYGQTGAGKTYSMEGPGLQDCDEHNKGLLPRVVDGMFDQISSSKDIASFTVTLSMVEIYMEKVRDLLDLSKGNIHLSDVTEVPVSDSAEALQHLSTGLANRTVGGTHMNMSSSRSHCAYLFTIQQESVKDKRIKTGKLILVDLAGSEKADKTGAEGRVLEEAKTINKSLSALGNVINALTSGSPSKANHIPYRDSKLTHILQDALGGNSRMALLCCCSPSTSNASETLSTLRFGMRAKHIKASPCASEVKSAKTQEEPSSITNDENFGRILEKVKIQVGDDADDDEQRQKQTGEKKLSDLDKDSEDKDDTLASFRKRLKGNQKGVGSGIPRIRNDKDVCPVTNSTLNSIEEGNTNEALSDDESNTRLSKKAMELSRVSVPILNVHGEVDSSTARKEVAVVPDRHIELPARSPASSLIEPSVARFDSIPLDLQLEVFSRVPTRYVLKLKIICKRFAQLTKDPHLHQLQNKFRRSLLLLRFRKRASVNNDMWCRLWNEDTAGIQHEPIGFAKFDQSETVHRIFLSMNSIVMICGGKLQCRLLVYNSPTLDESAVVSLGNLQLIRAGVNGRNIFVFGKLPSGKLVLKICNIDTLNVTELGRCGDRDYNVARCSETIGEDIYFIRSHMVKVFNTISGITRRLELPEPKVAPQGWFDAGTCVFNGVLIAHNYRHGLCWYDDIAEEWEHVIGYGLKGIHRLSSVGLGVDDANKKVLMVWTITKVKKEVPNKEELWYCSVTLEKTDMGLVSVLMEQPRHVATLEGGYKLATCLPLES